MLIGLVGVLFFVGLLLWLFELGSVAASTREAFLRMERIPHRSFRQVGSALRELAAGELDAVVYDEPILRYLAKKEFVGETQVVHHSFERQDYAIGLRPGSALREPINRLHIERISSEWWADLVFLHIGR